MNKIILNLLTVYKKYVSPLLTNAFGHSCRFTPTCSQYTKEAIETYGVLKGAWVGVKRIIRCNPFSDPGNDPLVKVH